jgi:hypothetical protein
MRRVAISRVCAIGLLCVAASSRGDSGGRPALPPSAESEPVTGEAVAPAPGSDTVRHDPFTPYDPGPPEAQWSYNQLNAQERALIDKGKGVTAKIPTLNAFAAAAAERAQSAAATSAEHQLGIENLETLGVVP